MFFFKPFENYDTVLGRIDFKKHLKNGNRGNPRPQQPLMLGDGNERPNYQPPKPNVKKGNRKKFNKK